MIRSYLEWIDITARGTSGDQVCDILESWKAAAYNWLDENTQLEQDNITLKAQLSAANARIVELTADIEVERDDNSHPLIQAALEAANARIAELEAAAEWHSVGAITKEPPDGCVIEVRGLATYWRNTHPLGNMWGRVEVTHWREVKNEN